MIKYINECRDCASPGYPCIGSSCSYRNVPHHYCDFCSKKAIYIVDESDYCENCLEKYLRESFGELTISEKAEALNISLEEID